MGYLGDYMVRVTIWKLNMNHLPSLVWDRVMGS